MHELLCILCAAIVLPLLGLWGGQRVGVFVIIISGQCLLGFGMGSLWSGASKQLPWGFLGCELGTFGGKILLGFAVGVGFRLKSSLF